MSYRTEQSGPRAKSYFEQQRELLLAEIGENFNNVLMNINSLNRSLEAIIAVGNEFSSVEALWSQFENVIGKEDEPTPNTNAATATAPSQNEPSTPYDSTTPTPGQK